ncbi:unnamed protein product [Orchesella dallaii]|uniref:Odorant receptor n=1 Tax=Orchesella dallaii TaxID=48710 RepID=A0ABP1S7J2_9HEXA
MISKAATRIIGLRTRLMMLSGATYLSWDSSKQQIVKPNRFWVLQAFNAQLGGLYIGIIFAVDLYHKLVDEDITEEGEYTKNEADLEYFASIMIEIGELVLALCIVFLGFVCILKLDDFIYSFNQILSCSNSFYDMLKEKNLDMNAAHKKSEKMLEFLLAYLFIVSIVLPFGLAAAVFHPIEATHHILETWFEIKVTFEWEFLPLFIFSVIVLVACGGTVSILCSHIACYFMLTTTYLDDLKPVAIFKRTGARRSILNTKFFGEMEDVEILKMYRIQRLLNILLNDFYKSLLVSYHHVAVLATAVVLICFAVKFNDIMLSGGIMAYVVVLGSVMAPFALMYFQSGMCGRLVKISNEFKRTSNKIGERRLLLAKFARSSDTFYIQVAHPFYTIDNVTFVEFCDQVVSYVITLLLW